MFKKVKDLLVERHEQNGVLFDMSSPTLTSKYRLLITMRTLTMSFDRTQRYRCNKKGNHECTASS